MFPSEVKLFEKLQRVCTVAFRVENLNYERFDAFPVTFSEETTRSGDASFI